MIRIRRERPRYPKRSLLAALLILAAIASFSPAQAATAKAPAAAEPSSDITALITEYGIFRTKKHDSLSGADTGTGRMSVAGTAELVKKTDVIPGEVGVEFGVRFTPSVPNAAAETVPVTVRLRHPSMVNPVTGVRTDRSEWTIHPENNTPTYTGWEFTHEWEVRPGIWLLQLLHGTDILNEQPFKVMPPAERSRKPKDLVISLSPAGAAKKPGRKSVVPTSKKSDTATVAATAKAAPKHAAKPVLKTALKDQIAFPDPEKGAQAQPSASESPRTEAVEDPVAVVQLGAFKDKAGAEVVADMIRRKGFLPTVLLFKSDTGHAFHVVVIGPFDDPREAQKTANKYRAEVQKPARVNFMGRKEFNLHKQ